MLFGSGPSCFRFFEAATAMEALDTGANLIHAPVSAAAAAAAFAVVVAAESRRQGLGLEAVIVSCWRFVNFSFRWALM